MQKNIQLPDFSKSLVLVFGDVMLDRYWHGDTSRISPEAPVPVVRVTQTEERPGGAGNVALNIAALGAKTTLFALAGEDAAADLLEHKLASANINTHFQRQKDMPTTVKLRVLSVNQQLIRLDFEDHFYHISASDLISRCVQMLPEAGALILSDYGKGSLKEIQTLIKAAKKAKVPVFVDPKSKDFSDYQGASFITPNFKEFEAVVGPCANEDEILKKGMNLIKKCDLQGLLITRGAKGMTLLSSNGDVYHLPTRAKEVFDVTGAGDTVIAVFASAVAAGSSIKDAVALSNLAAGIVVGKIGSATASLPEIRLAVSGISSKGAGIVNEDSLVTLINQAHRNGEKVVLTNGCFDILHSGHVAYLEEAKSCGQRLIVAVNDDDSVKRLKGVDRPINTLERRMAVLAGLSAVDWVVPFSEDTPERLICKLLPDVLVKGGDWQVEQIAGSKCVMQNGGEVKILCFEEGISTSKIVEKIRSK